MAKSFIRMASVAVVGLLGVGALGGVAALALPKTVHIERTAGNGSQTIVGVKRDAEVKMQLELGVRGRPIQTFLISSVENGSKVTWVQDGDLGYNPIARVIGTTLDSKLGPVYERGLQKLGKFLVTQTSSIQ